MAGHARYTALLDACVLFPNTVTDALLSLSSAGLFAPKWSLEIEDEWLTRAHEKFPHLEGKLERRRDNMRLAAPDWEVPRHAYQELLQGLELPDPDDRHVLAAAIAGHADCIVTANLADFPAEVVAVHSVEVIHPDDFIVMQLDIDEVAGFTAMKEMRARMMKPPRDAEEFAALLERSGLVSTAQRMREVAALI